MNTFKEAFGFLVEKGRWANFSALLDFADISTTEAEANEPVLTHDLITEFLQFSAGNAEWQQDTFSEFYELLHRLLLVGRFVVIAMFSSSGQNQGEGIPFALLDKVDEIILSSPERTRQWLFRFAQDIYEDGEEAWTHERVNLLANTIVSPVIKTYVSANNITPFPEMVQVPPGKYVVGKEENIQTVSLDGFSIGKYPVTNLQFLSFVIDTNYKTEAERKGGTSGPIDYYTAIALTFKRSDNWWSRKFIGSEIVAWTHYPVIYVSLNDAMEYCQWLSNTTGRQCRLPSSIEWEVAARGPKGYLFPWGNQFEKERCNTADRRWSKRDPEKPYLFFTDDGNLEDNRIPNHEAMAMLPPSSSPAGALAQFDASWCGASDLIGNVWEWCNTIHSRKETKDGEQISWMLKGGSWSSYYDKGLRKLDTLQSPSASIALALPLALVGGGKLTKSVYDLVFANSGMIYGLDYDLDAVDHFWASAATSASNIGFRVLLEDS